jgi:hypothetical protein
MRSIFLFATLLLSVAAIAQPPEYFEFVKKAEGFYAAKQYRESSVEYGKAFASFGDKGRPDDRYNAACSYALAGLPDSAFKNLYRIAEKTGYSNLGHLKSDSDLESIHKDKRWEPLLAIVKANKDKAEEGLNKPLVAILDSIYQDDQSYRMQIDKIQEKHGRNSPEMKALWKTIGEKDSLNLIKVTRILDKHGWLGPGEIGRQGNNTLFLVIQHSDLPVQEKYLPMMREAVKNKKAMPSALALLEDRVALRQGRKQIYGSQIMQDDNGSYVQPLEDPDNVDKRRAEVGLQPLSEYVKHWNMTWDPEEYKKRLPEYEERMKKAKE